MARYYIYSMHAGEKHWLLRGTRCGEFAEFKFFGVRQGFTRYEDAKRAADVLHPPIGQGWSLPIVECESLSPREACPPMTSCHPVEWYDAEYTDTFGGEANYGWVRRVSFAAPRGASDRTVSRRAKAALGMTGTAWDKEYDGRYKPRHEATVVFINHVGSYADTYEGQD